MNVYSLPYKPINRSLSFQFSVLKVNSESLLAANPDILDGVDDLMQLSYLNEPSVLYNLHYRYNRDVIYVSLNSYVKFSFYVCSSII